MNRRTFLKLTGLAVTAVATGCASASTTSERPNIVLVLADDLSPYELGCYGQKKIRTPNIDRLAAEGARFDVCYSACPVCAPSRCGLLTGLHMGHAQVRNNWERGAFEPGAKEGQWPLKPGTDTIARRLQSAGYRTGCFGKWGLGGPDTDGRPTLQGFDRFYGYNCQRHAHQYWPTHLWSNDTRVPVDNPVIHPHQRLPKGAAPKDPKTYERYRGRAYAPDLIIAEAERFINENAGQSPLFIFYATPLPHVGLTPPENEIDAYDFPETPYDGRAGYAPQRRPRAAYAAMVSRVDAEVGRIAEALRAKGQLENTLFIFSGDNGTTFNGGTDRAFFDATRNLRECKASIYEGGLRVPFVVRWPGHVPAGSHSSTPIWHVDLYPTFCAAAGVATPAKLDGVNILPLLAGGAAPKRPPFYWEFVHRQALREGDWRWVHYCPSGKTELYHLPSDPGERKNLAAQYPDRVAHGLRLMQAAHTPNPDFPLKGLDTAPDKK